MESGDAAQRELLRLAAAIGAPVSQLPPMGPSRDAEWWVEVEPRGYRLHIEDSGREVRSTAHASLDELLFEIFQHVTFSIASDWELENRGPGDSRRLLFGKQEELMAMLRPDWGRAVQAEHAAILRDHPYRDG